jgi:uncharacterized protein
MKITYIPRLLEPRILRSADQFPVLVLTGPRQSGKSTMLRNLFGRHPYCTLDDPMQRAQAINDPRGFLENLGSRAIIDEIQYAPTLLPYLKMVVDRDRAHNGRFLLTGSQIFPLMAGIGESLAGRAVLHELLGFSSAELDLGKAQTSPLALYQALFRGFYPEPALRRVDRVEFYRSYLQTYLERDIRQIRSVHDLHTFQVFLELLGARAGAVLKLQEVAKECGISHPTARQWLSLLETTRIVYLLRPFFRNVSKRAIRSPKLYFTDTGLLSFLLKYPDAKTLMVGPSAGAFFENFLVMEVLKHKLNHGSLFEPYFFRDSNGNEIDLLLDFGRFTKLIEIKRSQTLRSEHFSSLTRAAKTFPGSKLHLVSLDREASTYMSVTANHWNQLGMILEE